VSKHGEGVSPPSAAKIFYSWYMNGPGRETEECISPEVVRRSAANAKVATYIEPGKRQRTDDWEECYSSIVARINEANDALGLH
jgi:hypothetical protein